MHTTTTKTRPREKQQCPNVIAFKIFSFAPTMCWQLSLSKGSLLLLCLGLGLELCLGLGFRKSQRPELQGLCSYQRIAKGNTGLPHHGSLHPFLLGTTLTPMQGSLLQLGLGFKNHKAQHSRKTAAEKEKHRTATTRLPPHPSLWYEPCAGHVSFSKKNCFSCSVHCKGYA